MKAPRALKNLAAGLLAAGLAFQPVFAAAGFTDVAENYWAVPYIGLAKTSGLIEGYVNADGTAEFRAENFVTKQECLVMLCNTLKLAKGLSAEEDLSASYESFFQTYAQPEAGVPQGIPAWAKIYVSYALSQGICSEQDFSAVLDENGRSGGYSYADRQLIAKWTAKALGCEESAVFSPIYQDWSDAAPENHVYLDSLYRHGIMQGNKGMFYPQNGVKRSEMAAICTRLLGVTADEAKGTVTDYGMLDPDGSLKEGSRLFDREAYLYGLSFKERMIHHHGILKSFEPKAGLLVLEEKGREVSLQLAPGTVLLADGRAVTSANLQKQIGTELDLSYLLAGEKTLIIQTRPMVLDGYIRNVQEMNGYTLLTISLDDGTYANYCLTDSSLTEGKINRNRSCRFIADGMVIVEMR